MTDKPVITRFAPSPTGYLHIGGARTALFNYLFAKKHGGQFLLRIEDTDRARSTDDAINAILEGLEWLGLHWDGAPVYQHKNETRHKEIVEILLNSGHAYRCYASQEELATMREDAKARGEPMRYDGRWRDRNEKDAPGDVKPVIRFRAPQEGVTVINDSVQGSVTIENSQLDDLIIARADGTPTYNLAVVVDDHDMGVTHVIRGDDHFTNAFRQTQILEALGWDRPIYAHIPLIHGEDGAKLSKRHGATAVGDYRVLGYLPDAMRNYLARLGWSHGDDEIFSTKQALEWFSLDAINRGPARFDTAKLDHLNHHYLKHAPADHLLNEIEWLRQHSGGAPLDDLKKNRLARALPALTERGSTLRSMIDDASFALTERPLPLTEKAENTLTEEARATLKAMIEPLSSINNWSKSSIEGAVRSFAEQGGLKFGAVAQPLRMALSGGMPSPGIFDMAESLGSEETLARITDQTR